MGAYRVQQHEAFVHHLQRAGQALVVPLKLLQDFLAPLLSQLNQETFGRVHVMRRNPQLLSARADFHNIVPRAHLPRLLVKHNPILV